MAVFDINKRSIQINIDKTFDSLKWNAYSDYQYDSLCDLEKYIKYLERLVCNNMNYTVKELRKYFDEPIDCNCYYDQKPCSCRKIYKIYD